MLLSRNIITIVYLLCSGFAGQPGIEQGPSLLPAPLQIIHPASQVDVWASIIFQCPCHSCLRPSRDTAVTFSYSMGARIIIVGLCILCLFICILYNSIACHRVFALLALTYLVPKHQAPHFDALTAWCILRCCGIDERSMWSAARQSLHAIWKTLCS